MIVKRKEEKGTDIDELETHAVTSVRIRIRSISVSYT